MWVGLIQSLEGSKRLQAPGRRNSGPRCVWARDSSLSSFLVLYSAGLRRRWRTCQARQSHEPVPRSSHPSLHFLSVLFFWRALANAGPRPWNGVIKGNQSAVVPSLVELWSYQRRWIRTDIQTVDNYRDSEKESNENKHLRRPELWKVFHWNTPT